MCAAQRDSTFLENQSPAGLDWFERFAVQTAVLSGKPLTFLTAVVVVVVWALTGPMFHYSDTWQLDRHVPDGVSDPGHPEPRHARPSDQAVGADPGGGRRTQRARGSGKKSDSALTDIAEGIRREAKMSERPAGDRTAK